MLDINFIRENLDLIKINCINRKINFDVNRFLIIDSKTRELEKKIQTVRTKANDLASNKENDRLELKRNLGRKLREEITQLESELNEIRSSLYNIVEKLPNLTHKNVPIGVDDKADRIIKNGDAPLPVFNFKPQDHLDLGKNLNIIDMEAGSKVAGSGFYFLKGKGALLELGLQNYVIQKLIARGYQFQITPDIARNEVLSGTGYIPRGPETNTYSIENTNLSLIATAEIPLCGQFKDKVIEMKDLPIKLVGLSHCFRTERASGRATRGIYRVHQFTKVEMFVACPPENAESAHQELLDIEMEIFNDLGLPYRVLDIASGNLGASAYRKFDIEVWMPGRGNKGEYGEVTSTSNCTDYQSRRLNIKYKSQSFPKCSYLYTLNGTAIAISRAIAALLENYQTEIGTINFPPRIAKIFNFSTIERE